MILSCDNLQAPGLVAISRALVTKSAKGCCQELLGNEKHVVLHGKSIVTLHSFTDCFLGGGRFRPFMYIVLQRKPILVPFYVLF